MVVVFVPLRREPHAARKETLYERGLYVPAPSACAVERPRLVARARGPPRPGRVCPAPALSPPQPPANLPQGETWARTTYQLAVGDRVRFISWNIPELSCEVLVEADGTVVYSYVGTVQARGRTVAQLETALETELGQRLAAGVERLDPHVLEPARRRD
jgi:hypothetical protein